MPSGTLTLDDAEPHLFAADDTNQPPPLTDVVHKAMMSLGTNLAMIPEHYKPEFRRLISPMNGRLRSAYREASILLLLGCEFDFEAVFLNGEVSQDTERLKNFVSSLPRSSPSALERAAKVYHNALDVDWMDVDGYSWKHLKETTRDRLGENVQDLSWCNMIWSQLFETGVTRVDVARLFSSIVMIAMHVRCPIQEFPSQWFALGNARTFDELHVMELSAGIRKKPDWRRKLQDQEVVSKWREEAFDQGATPSMFDFLMGELRWFADELDSETGTDHSTVPGVFINDNLIPPLDRDALRLGADILAAVPDNEKDWHLNSNRQVLDLVHPSRYPYVRGRTPRILHQEVPLLAHNVPPESTAAKTDEIATSILRFLHPPSSPALFHSPVAALAATGKGVATSGSMDGADIVERKWRSNSNYQWLPVDVEVSANSPLSVRFLSYINNLHPATNTPGGSLYPVLERILSRFVPLFERTLTETRRRRTGNAGVRTQFLRSSVEEYWDPPEPNYDALDGSATETAYDQVRDDWKAERQFIRPVVGPFVPPPPAGPAQVTLGNRTIQVIIKMANVHLTPEDPEYKGGSWHVEGTDNERIVATGIYYYESENISEPSLSFRQAIEEPPYEQYEHEHLEELYGMAPPTSNDDIRANQDLGDVATVGGRCICFPNGMQHRLSSFKLTDPTKPGHRKILVFFLIDPSQRVLSTSDVPPQQIEWLLSEIRHQTGTRLSALPPELFDLVCEHVRAVAYTPLGNEGGSSSAWLMPLAEAKEHRLALMNERSDFAGKVNDHLYERQFNLCEH